jgi:hypothetical protein
MSCETVGGAFQNAGNRRVIGHDKRSKQFGHEAGTAPFVPREDSYFTGVGGEDLLLVSQFKAELRAFGFIQAIQPSGIQFDAAVGE